MASNPAPLVRPATPDDVPELLAMIRELAEFERAADEVEATEEVLHRSLFGDSPAVFAHVADVDGDVAGMAIWFLNFSTWLGTHGIYLEDLYVRPQARGTGAGRALLSTLAAICVERGYARLEWWVLHWNPAREFYAALGAVPMDEWVPYRLTGAPLRALASSTQA